jgi:hypothetical protein
MEVMGQQPLVSVVDDDESVRESLPDLRLGLLARGPAECLFKPFSETALMNAINTALGMR